MTYFSKELFNIFIFISASIGLTIVLFVIVYLINFTSKIDYEKSSIYECGFSPFSETSYPFEVQFAIIAIMFLLFDIEVLYLYPLITSILYFNFIDAIYFLLFFIILTVGIIYETSKGIYHSAIELDNNLTNINKLSE